VITAAKADNITSEPREEHSYSILLMLWNVEELAKPIPMPPHRLKQVWEGQTREYLLAKSAPKFKSTQDLPYAVPSALMKRIMMKT
jgi:hypothetical protein